MMSSACPVCGTDWTPPGPCGICGHRTFRELRLCREDGVIITMGRLATKIGSRWARRNFGDDGRFWDEDCQMTFEPHSEGWFLVPNPAAVNETLLNGTTLTERLDVQSGMVISVGRAARGVQKTTFTIQLD